MAATTDTADEDAQNQPASGIAVVHLARAANGPGALERFLSSYERHGAGLPHDLVLVLKGFDDDDAAAALERTAAHQPVVVRIPDAGLDLDAYAAVARTSTYEHLCFLNSHSEIQVDGWLGHLIRPVMEGRAGAVGATGSWASHVGYSLWQTGLSGGYRSAASSRSAVRDGVVEALDVEYGGDVGHWGLSVINAAKFLGRIPRFPNPHLRTNAFAIRRDVFVGLEIPHPLAKHGAHLIESGNRSITRRVTAAGPGVLIADADGRTWAPDTWPEAEVFWQRDQRRLLISDNQTRTYEAAGPKGRRALEVQAWGARAPR